ncbi:MAG: hypothetical protein U0794_14035 [Isosphaeraceae bacterium]
MAQPGWGWNRNRLARAACMSLAVMLLAADTHQEEDPQATAFGLSEPIICSEIRGFEDYERHPTASLTAEEKLLIYYRPLHYKSRKVKGMFEAHLTQDGTIHRKGEKAVLWSKKKLVDYQVKTPEPPEFIYHRNTIALKGLKPGEYVFELTLRDEVGQGAPALKSIPFRIVPTPAASPDEPDDAKPETPATPSRKRPRGF